MAGQRFYTEIYKCTSNVALGLKSQHTLYFEALWGWCRENMLGTSDEGQRDQRMVGEAYS